MKPAFAATLLLWRPAAQTLAHVRGRLPAAVEMFRADAGDGACVYAEDGMQQRVSALLPAAAACERFVCLQSLEGFSAGSDASWHYVVETDVLAEHETDFNAWYSEEHLPGLAAVRGVVRAARYRRDTGEGPRYRACYDLASLEAFGSPAWLAVRSTAWSTRVRPAFRHTERTMYRRVPAEPPLSPPESLR